ncbi:MAG: hypothetical protein NZ921_02080 [Candidatus Caldarchaeum sp.]|nr:hypothetical protein [Candidatus Caldarchaeum sp.]MCS7133574.1 hypothetical protein [Candidatus Caldarchaeum sp.]MCX8201686.1 hypothetical protein [Candidatus Caldarchaeum sp.]MDW8434786.1 hypothetical protein [Candidatus Caldarchaeum sp.]
MEKSIKVTLACPVCRGTNLLPAKIEGNIPQAFECLDCQSQFSILKPKILGYEVSREESREEVEKKQRRRRTFAEILDGILLGWLLRR